jgi:dipeptidyl-peptidase-4
MTGRIFVALAFGLGLMGTVAQAQTQAQVQPEPRKLTLDRIFASPSLNGSAPRALKISPDGKLVTLLRNRPDDRERYDLWAIDTTTGAARMLVDSARVGTGAELTEAEKMQRERARIGGLKGIVAYDWAPDGKTILVPLDGDLYLATLDGQVTRLTNTPGGELNPVVSPKGGFVSFVRDGNLVVEGIADHRETKVTGDGGGMIHWGEAEFVAQEEMDRYTGYWWAPDDRRIAVARFDEAPVGVVTRAAIGATGTRTYEQRYPAAGTPNVLIDLYLVNPDGSGLVKVDLGSEADQYLVRVNWDEEGKALYVQRMTRDQKRLDMLRVDPATGAATLVFTETQPHWINLSDGFRALKDGSLIWWSQRDGYGHLYRWQAGQWTQLTKGAWEVDDLTGVDEAKGLLYFTGNRETVLERHLYVTSYLKPGKIDRLTEAGWWNGATMDKKATRVIVSRSNASQPAQVYLADTSGKRLSWIEENRITPDHPYAPYYANLVKPTYGTIKASDGTTLHYSLLMPRLEPGKHYPVFMEHYGGPHAQDVKIGWDGGLHQYLVQQGWVVFQVDNRGESNRGKAFEDQIDRAMGSVEVEDQLAALDWIRAQPFVNPAKVATYGWSYGGYMTLKLLAAKPGAYAAGIAGAPVTRWELYDTFYTERYLGQPKGPANAYPASDALIDAPKISDPLLLLHGMSDDNVVFENSTELMSVLQEKAVPFEMMVYPGYTHRVSGPKISVHVWTTILDFLKRRGIAPDAP